MSEKLNDNRDLQHFLQNTQDVSSLLVYCSCNRWVASSSTFIINLIIPSLGINITVLIIVVNLPNTLCMDESFNRLN